MSNTSTATQHEPAADPTNGHSSLIVSDVSAVKHIPIADRSDDRTTLLRDDGNHSFPMTHGKFGLKFPDCAIGLVYAAKMAADASILSLAACAAASPMVFPNSFA